MPDTVFRVIEESRFLSSWGFMPNRTMWILFFIINLSCCVSCYFKSPVLFVRGFKSILTVWPRLSRICGGWALPMTDMQAWLSQNNGQAMAVVLMSYNSTRTRESQILKNNIHLIIKNEPLSTQNTPSLFTLFAGETFTPSL